MSTVELRRRLIEKIEATNDDQLLEQANRLFELEPDESAFYTLTGAQKAVIEESRLQIKQGKFLSDDEANKDIDEWLKK